MIGMQSDENRTRENCGYLSNKLFFPQLFFFFVQNLYFTGYSDFRQHLGNFVGKKSTQ